ncbi:MAG: hypothetical protein AB8G11_10420 [Saprospiraceae bacterium]
MIKNSIQILFLVLLISACNPKEIQEKLTEINYPTELSTQIDTLELAYIAWACACPNWLPTEFLDSMDIVSAKTEDYCIFLESVTPKLKIPNVYMMGCCENKIRVIGSFYKEKGYSRDYQSPTSQTPQVAKVFRFTDIEVIKPYTIQHPSKPLETIVIEEDMKAYYEE